MWYLSEQWPALIDYAQSAFDASVDGLVVPSRGLAGGLEVVHDRLAFAGIQFDYRREGLRPAVSVYQLLGANQSEEREHGVFFQNRQISRLFVAHRKNHHLKRSFSELRLDDSTTTPGLGQRS